MPLIGAAKWLVFEFHHGQLFFITKARTDKGLKMILRDKEKYAAAAPRGTVTVKVISIEEILNWEQRGMDELERLAKL